MHNSYFSHKLFDKYHQIQFQKNLMKRFRESSNSSKVLGPKMLHVSICGIIWILLKNPK